MTRALLTAVLLTLAFAAPASASEWAHAVNIVPIRATPDTGAKRVATTRLLTEDKLAEVYAVYERRDDWVRIGVPARPNGRTLGAAMQEDYARGGSRAVELRRRVDDGPVAQRAPTALPPCL